MEKLAYFKIEEEFTPRQISDILEKAKISGLDNVIVLHEGAAELKTAYKKKLLDLFRGAFRNKVGIYLADDSFFASGTAFGQVSSVRELWQKVLVRVKAQDVGENEKVLAKRDDECIIATVMDYNDKYPYGHYPSLTDPFAAQLVIESVYEPVLREYAKFAGYELKGFAAIKPLYDIPENEGVIYSPEALELYVEKYKKKADLFTLLEKGGDYEKYMLLVRQAMEENFLLPIKKFCAKNKLEFILCGGEKSVSPSFCEKQKIVFLSDTPKSKNGYLMPCDDIEKVMEAGLNKMGIVTKISPGVKKLSELRSFFATLEKGWEVLKIEDFNGFKSSDMYILTNMEDRVKEISFLLDEPCCIYDWESKEYYEFEKMKTYAFYPYSFMCITKKSGFYTDKLPTRVGGVRCKDILKETSLEFEKKENMYGFSFPDEPLYGKCVEIEADCDCLMVDMGTMKHTFVSKPYILPLFEFLRDSSCRVECFNGEVTKIRIIE